MYILKKREIILTIAKKKTRTYALGQRSFRFSLSYQRLTWKTITLKKQKQQQANVSYSWNDRPESGGVSTPFSTPKTVKFVASEAGAASFWAFLFAASPPPLVSLVGLRIIRQCQLSQSVFSSPSDSAAPPTGVCWRAERRWDATDPDICFLFSLWLNYYEPLATRSSKEVWIGFKSATIQRDDRTPFFSNYH